ncbi:hypothetical protein [Streptomyces luteireticuli]|uniref:Uncharacterized protein n=1 Tax=Streptomyces luteireticuli TaxID=173858 RepID=A0ABN0YZA7_9ACTN
MTTTLYYHNTCDKKHGIFATWNGGKVFQFCVDPGSKWREWGTGRLMLILDDGEC